MYGLIGSPQAVGHNAMSMGSSSRTEKDRLMSERNKLWTFKEEKKTEIAKRSRRYQKETNRE